MVDRRKAGERRVIRFGPTADGFGVDLALVLSRGFIVRFLLLLGSLFNVVRSDAVHHVSHICNLLSDLVDSR